MRKGGEVQMVRSLCGEKQKNGESGPHRSLTPA